MSYTIAPDPITPAQRAAQPSGMSWHGPVTLHGTVTDIQCKGPMKDHPGLTLYTAMVQPFRSRRAMAVTVCTKTGEGTPEPDEFLKAFITDILMDAIPAA